MDDSTPRTKTCRKCGATLPATPEFFSRQSGNKDGLRGRCRPCLAADNRAYHDRNRAEVNDRARAAYARDSSKEAEYRATHRAEHRQYLEKHRAENPEKYRRWSANRYPHQRDAARRGWQWFFANMRILKAAQGCCDCGTRDGRLHHHHVDPATKKYCVSRMSNAPLESLMDEIAKCIVLCGPCHVKRHRNDHSRGYHGQYVKAPAWAGDPAVEAVE